MDANQNMEMFRAYLSQSRSPDPSNNFFDEQLPQRQQQDFDPFFLNYPAASPVSNTALQQFQSQPQAPAPNMCIPSLSSYNNSLVMSSPSLSMEPQALLRHTNIQLQPSRRQLTEQERFLIFVKILFKCLEKSSDPCLKPRAKAVVTECIRGNRLADNKYMPLQDAVERRLRRQVGERYWTRAKLYYDHYMVRKGLGSNSGVQAQDLAGSIAV